MNQLKVVSYKDQLVTDSRDVAVMVGKRHPDLLRSIDNYNDILLNAELRSVDFFIESSYRDSSGKENKCYLLTRKGCDMVANKMTGEKGVLFTAAYVTKFEEMEDKLKRQPTSLELALEAALKHEQDIKEVKSDISLLKDTMRIDSLQQQQIQQAARKVVVQALGGKNSRAYKEIGRKAFIAFWYEFKCYFNIPRYPDLPKIKQGEALDFIRLWRPSTSLQMEIDTFNRKSRVHG